MKTLLLLALLLSPLAHAQTAPASMNGEWFVQESAGGSDSVKTCEFTQKAFRPDRHLHRKGDGKRPNHRKSRRRQDHVDDEVSNHGRACHGNLSRSAEG